MTPDLFRFGASSLLNDVLMQIRKQKTGQLPVRRTTSRRTDGGRARAQRHAAVPALTEWEYAPAPEARDIVTLEERYGLFVGGEFVEPQSGEWFADDLAGDRGAARRGRAGRRGGRRPRRRGRARAPSRTAGRRSPPSERAKYLFRIARILQERSRELAVLESARTAASRSERVARRRPPARGRALLLLRGLGRQARVRVPEPAAASRSASPARSSPGTSRC